MIGGGGQFDPDKATEMGRFIFRMVVGAMGTSLAVLSVCLLVVGLMGDAEKLGLLLVGLLVMLPIVWWWRQIDRRMTRAIEVRRSEQRADSGAEVGRTRTP